MCDCQNILNIRAFEKCVESLSEKAYNGFTNNNDILFLCPSAALEKQRRLW